MIYIYSRRIIAIFALLVENNAYLSHLKVYLETIVSPRTSLRPRLRLREQRYDRNHNLRILFLSIETER